MGDRTSVKITLRKKDYERLLANRGESEDVFRTDIGAECIDDDGDLVSIRGYEVDYADWSELQDLLQDNLIPYDKTWDSGDDFSAGESFVRVVNGEVRELEFYEYESNLIEFLKAVKDLPADEIKAKVLEEYEKQFPWEIEKL